MGYSWDNILEDNTIEYSRFVGIAAEHAHNILIQNNTLRMNTEGIRLWTRGGEVVKYWQEHKVTHTITVKKNLFESNHTGVSAYSSDDAKENRCHHIQLDGNTFQDNKVGVRFSQIKNGQIISNRFINNAKTALHLVDNDDVVVGDANHYDNNTTNLLDS
jgi:parallel beta-helix repeat protein